MRKWCNKVFLGIEIFNKWLCDHVTFFTCWWLRHGTSVWQQMAYIYGFSQILPIYNLITGCDIAYQINPGINWLKIMIIFIWNQMKYSYIYCISCQFPPYFANITLIMKGCDIAYQINPGFSWLWNYEIENEMFHPNVHSNFVHKEH